MRIESRIAELIDTNPGGKGHAGLSWKDTIAAGSDAAHDDQTGSGTAQVAADVAYVAAVVVTALRGHRRQEKATESFGLHVEFDEGRREESVLAVAANVARGRHGNERFQPEERQGFARQRRGGRVLR